MQIEACDRIPVLAILVACQLILDHVNHDVVADQATLVHDLFRFPTQWCLLCDLCSEHVTGCLPLLDLV